MRLTRYTDYALRVLMHLALNEDRLCSIGEMARTYGVSHNHLTKVVVTLTRHGFVATTRGRAGGLRLARPAAEIGVGEVVRHTEEGFSLAYCAPCLLSPACGLTGVLGEAAAALLAVLDKRAGLSFANLDVFLNVVGGVRMQEPAGDLAVAAALASSVYDKTLPADAVFVGEVGLGGEIRAVSQVERRIAEAEKMGMKTAYVGERSVPRRAPKSIRVEGVPSLGDLFKRLFR